MSVRWISAVWSLSPYKGEHLLLHLALADFANDEGMCFPSVPTLARKARCSEVWARKGIRQMIDDGLLQIIERGLGRGNVNRYLLLPLADKTATQLPVTAKAVTASDENRNSVASDTSIQNRHKPSLDQESINRDFAAFWEAYPRKVGKGKARTLFAKVMRRDDAPTIDALVAAVAAYAATQTDIRFVAHPATWLGGERWLDEVTTAKPAASVPVDPAIAHAESLGGAYALTGRSIDDLQQATAHKSDAERDAAHKAYTHTINMRRQGK